MPRLPMNRWNRLRAEQRELEEQLERDLGVPMGNRHEVDVRFNAEAEERIEQQDLNERSSWHRHLSKRGAA